jgi:hypothetical protein
MVEPSPPTPILYSRDIYSKIPVRCNEDILKNYSVFSMRNSQNVHRVQFITALPQILSHTYQLNKMQVNIPKGKKCCYSASQHYRQMLFYFLMCVMCLISDHGMHTSVLFLLAFFLATNLYSPPPSIASTVRDQSFQTSLQSYNPLQLQCHIYHL